MESAKTEDHKLWIQRYFNQHTDS